MWAVMNFRAIEHYKQEKNGLKKKDNNRRSIVDMTSLSPGEREHVKELNRKIENHVVPAINGFFHSIALAGDRSLQDILRLLTLWFNHASQKGVEAALDKGFNSISIDTWLAGATFVFVFVCAVFFFFL